jgi:hypothetical protein
MTTPNDLIETHTVTCPYCDANAPLVTGAKVYPHLPHLHHKRFYLCSPCNAYVGCHDGTTRPLGRLADAALRHAKIAAHAAFDPLWQSHQMTRSAAYRWLRKELNISEHDCHIGKFDVETCRRVVQLCRQRSESHVS